MKIPGIIVSQHERENTHLFANKNNGFINLGCYDDRKTVEVLRRELVKMIRNNGHRRKMYNRTLKYDFTENKKKVLRMILETLDR